MSLQKNQTIKQLQTQLKKAEGELDAMKIQSSNQQREITAKSKVVNSLKDRIKQMERPSELKVSEHAILRYFERVKGYDLKEIEQEILDHDVRNAAAVLGGSGTYPTRSGFRVTLKDNMVVTVGI